MMTSVVLNLLIPMPIHVCIDGKDGACDQDQHFAYKVDYIPSKRPPEMMRHVLLLVSHWVNCVVYTSPQA